jgi:Tfp pilus assembly protein PilX
MKRSWHASADSQRGAAALIVVVVLFFILAMVTAYAGRNLIFEQRTSVNNQRATQAFEVAESGLEFAIGLLASGRVDDACAPTSDTAKDTFRQRHLSPHPSGDGRFTLSGAQPNLRPTCMMLEAGATCSCPAASAPALAVPVGLAPTFQLKFETGGTTQPGIVRVESTGCSSIGSQCYAAVANSADAVAKVSVLLGLNSALSTPPIAALTARGTVNLNDAAIQITNTDVRTRGVTIDAGGPVQNAGNARLNSSPGTPSSLSILAADPSLSTLSADRMFKSVYGMDRVTYATQPAVVRVSCSVGDCASSIALAVSDNPGRMIWAEGPVTIGSNILLGSAASPVMLFIKGNLTVSANLQLHGVVYLYDTDDTTTWNTAAGSTLIHGAVVAEGDLSVLGTPAISFDPDVLRTINLTQGSMVRVPGSWRDFAAGS